MSPPRTKFGLTWWGQRWIGALESLGAEYANRLPRGRTYARRGTVSELSVAAGEVTARVRGSRANPYRVRLRLPAFSDAEWGTALEALTRAVRHSAALLDGCMPDDVDDVLGSCGLSLFPRPRELGTSCSCPDWANPCKHVAAVHYVLAQTFDADPFLLPQLRGRDRDALLAGLRAARAGTRAESESNEAAGDAVALTELVAATLFEARGNLAGVAALPRAPEDPGAVTRRLGPPPDADADVLEELVVEAAERAWKLASGGLGPDCDPGLLRCLRERAPATTAELAEALGEPVKRVRSRLNALLETGAVQRTGHARGTRYWA